MEERAKKGKSFKLMGDGMQRLLTGDEFYEKVVEHERLQREIASDREARKLDREERNQLMIEWKAKDKDRKTRNTEKRSQWKQKVSEWEAERDQAKLEKRRPAWKKPNLGPLEKAAPRPRAIALPDIDEVDEEDEEDDDDDDD